MASRCRPTDSTSFTLLALAASLAASGCPADDHGRWFGGAQWRSSPTADGSPEGGDAGLGKGDEDGGVEPGCRMPHPCKSGIEIPRDQHYAAPGLCVRAVALQQDRLRQISFAPNGDLFGITTAGEIRRYRDTNCDGMFGSEAPERVLWASTGGNGNNVHVDAAAGFVYAGVLEGVKRWRYDVALDQGVDEQTVVVGHPSSGNHTFATVHVFDGFLYVHSGSEGNVSDPMSPEYDTERSLIKRFALASFDPATPFDWTAGEVYSLGLRNMVGFTQHANGDLYGVVNGIDDLHYAGQDIHDRNPAEIVVRLAPGAAFGYPYCFHALEVARPDGSLFPIGTPLHTELAADAGFINPHDDAWCAANTQAPLTFLDAHSAPLDIAFLAERSRALPRRWTGGAFVTLHGSWNRDQSTGHKVVWLPFSDDGSAAEQPRLTSNGLDVPYEVVFGGGSGDATCEEGRAPVDGGWGWLDDDGRGEDLVRPVGVAVSPLDGTLYVSSDNAQVLGTDGPGMNQGALYRIAHH
jgi:glucose/arabinose dehydrogenase